MIFPNCVEKIGRSGVREIMEKSESYTDVVHFEIGNLNFTAPPKVVDEISRIVKAENKVNHYGTIFGLESFRKAAASFLNRRGVGVDHENIIALPGSAIGTAICYKTFVSEDENVMVPDPCWPNHYLQTLIFNTNCIRYPLNHENNYIADVETLSKYANKKTKLILINSPSNPLGTHLEDSAWNEIVDWAAERRMIIVSDEAYSEMYYGREKHVYAFQKNPKMVVSLYSLSKTFGMTGWRCGFMVADKTLIPYLGKIAEPLYSCVSYLTLRAGEIALDYCESYIQEIKRYYNINRNIIVDFLNKVGIPHTNAQAGLYIWVDVSKYCASSYKFCIEALDKYHIGLAPGDSFGEQGKCYVRIAFCRDRKEIIEGVSRLSRLFNKE